MRAAVPSLPFGISVPRLPGGSFECTPFVTIEIERRGEQLERFFMRRAPHPALERTDPIDADAGTFG